MQIKPLADRVVVKPFEEMEVKRGGIIIPDTAKEKPQQGKVIEVGEGRKDEKGNRISMDVKKGDTILFGKYAGTEVKIEDKEYLIIREEDVLGIVQKEK